MLGVYIGPSYNFSTRLQEAEYGARLRSRCDCWAAGFGLRDSFNDNEVQLQFQLTLGGLASIGQTRSGAIHSKATGWPAIRLGWWVRTTDKGVLEEEQDDVRRDPENHGEPKAAGPAEQACWIAALVVLVDQIQVTQNRESDEGLAAGWWRRRRST